jgi:hypothetical protein
MKSSLTSVLASLTLTGLVGCSANKKSTCPLVHVINSKNGICMIVDENRDGQPDYVIVASRDNLDSRVFYAQGRKFSPSIMVYGKSLVPTPMPPQIYDFTVDVIRGKKPELVLETKSSKVHYTQK